MSGILARELAVLGCDVTVLTDTVDDDGQRVTYSVVRTRSSIKRWQTFHEADVVLMMNVSLPGVLLAGMARTPVVLSHHGLYGGNGLLDRWKSKLRLSLTRHYPNVSCSRFVANQLPSVSTVIRNAIDLSLLARSGERKSASFVLCARLVSEKGVDLAIRALAILRHQYRLYATLTIVGDGLERQALEALAKELNVFSVTRFTGALLGEQLAQELSCHFCALVPSRAREGFGLAALEGLATCGRVIVTNRGGLPETVGAFGAVVECDENSLAHAMSAMIREPQNVGSAANARECPEKMTDFFREHSPDRIAAQYLNVLFGAVSGR